LAGRLTDVVNIKDWGAVGNGIANDLSNIQAAIDYAYNTIPVGKGCDVFFPAGTYNLGTGSFLRLNPPTTAGKKINLIGAGRDCTILKGVYATGNYPTGVSQVGAVGFLLQANYTSTEIVVPGLVQGLTIWNDSQDPSSGCLYYFSVGSSSQSLIDCRLIGNQALFLCENTFAGHVRNCIAQCNIALLGANSADIRLGAAPKTIGYAFDQGVLINNIAIGYDYGLAMIGADASTGNAVFVSNNRAIRCNHGICLGRGSQSAASHANSSGGVCLISNVTERCGIGIFGAGCGGSFIAGNVSLGEEGPAEPAQIANMTWSSTNGGTVEVTTTVNHGINLWPYSIILRVPPQWTPNGLGYDAVGTTVTASNKFTFTGIGSSPSPAFTSGTWNYPRQGGIAAAGAGSLTFIGNRSFSKFYVEDFSVGEPFVGPGSQDKNVVMCTQGDRNWYLGNDGVTPGANWQFIQCSGSNMKPYIEFGGLSSGSVPPIWAGQEFNIVKSGIQTNFAGVVGAGSSTVSYKVRHNGTNWIRIG
jgi:hypothetical protein